MYTRRPTFISATAIAALACNAYLATGSRAVAGGPIIVPLDAATIQAAIDMATDGDVVEVMDGTWTGAGNRNLNFGGKLITVRSASGNPALCTIDCENAGRGFIFQGGEDATAVVSGFTILNGAPPPNASGGGMLIVPSGVPSNPTITNCIFRGNSGNFGGAIYMDHCSSLVTNCLFLENNANFGAGVHIIGGFPELTNCVFFDNIAFDGGGLYVVSGALPLIVNCTLGSNGALGLGGGLYTTFASLAQIRNCVFWGNLDTSGSLSSGQISGTAESTPSVLYSTVQGGWADTGNTDADPMFVDAVAGDLRLSSGSPAIDSGNNTSVPDDATDLDGDGDLVEAVPLDLDVRQRFHDDPVAPDTGVAGNGHPDDIVDMGAYEFGALTTPRNRDLLWRQDNGSTLIWLMDGTQRIGTGPPGFVSLVWQMAGTGDFDGDGHADILWHNTTTGQVVIWFIVGTQRISHAIAGSANPNIWEVAGVGDFDGTATTTTATADILWRNMTTGQTVIWLMNGAQMIGVGSPGTASIADWEIVGVGDFDGDGHDDILWYRPAYGQAFIWFVEGVQRVGFGSAGSANPNIWTIQGIGNFDGQATTSAPTADILWRNNSGQVVIWLMNGATRIGFGSPGNVGLVWQIADVGDFDADGFDDILWRNTNPAGLVFAWFIEGTSRVGAGSLGGVSQDWQIVGSEDFDGE